MRPTSRKRWEMPIGISTCSVVFLVLQWRWLRSLTSRSSLADDTRTSLVRMRLCSVIWGRRGRYSRTILNLECRMLKAVGRIEFQREIKPGLLVRQPGKSDVFQVKDVVFGGRGSAFLVKAADEVEPVPFTENIVGWDIVEPV